MRQVSKPWKKLGRQKKESKADRSRAKSDFEHCWINEMAWKGSLGDPVIAIGEFLVTQWQCHECELLHLTIAISVFFLRNKCLHATFQLTFLRKVQLLLTLKQKLTVKSVKSRLRMKYFNLCCRNAWIWSITHKTKNKPT